MKRKKVAILLNSEPDYDEYAFKYFILSVNKIQEHYEFYFPEYKDPDDDDDDGYYFQEDYYDTKKLLNEIKNKIKKNIYFDKKPDYVISIISSIIDKNLFFNTFPSEKIGIITTNRWDKYFSPPSLFEYLLNCIFVSLLFFNEKLSLSSHRDTRGCSLDYTFYKDDLRVGIVLGYICDNCKEEIRKSMGDKFLKDFLYVLSRDWIGAMEKFDTIAHNLKRYFKFNINKDSGFNKSFFDKAKEHFSSLPKDTTLVIITLILGIIIGQLLP